MDVIVIYFIWLDIRIRLFIIGVVFKFCLESIFLYIFNVIIENFFYILFIGVYKY